MPEEETKEKKIPTRLYEAKQSPPPEPVNIAPFQGDIVKKGLTSPPPEPVTTSPFSQMKTTQSKESNQGKQTEGQ